MCAAKEMNRICGVIAGEYRLNLMSLSQLRVIHVTGYLSVPFTLKDKNVDLGSLEIAPAFEILGTVSVEGAPEGSAIPSGIQVRLPSTESLMLGFDDGGIAPVQADGSFKAPRVFPGDYAVRLTGLPAGYYVIDATQRGRSVRSGGLRAGNGDLRVVLATDRAAVSGRVMTDDKTPIPDPAVILLRQGSGRPLVVHSDQTGSYRFVAGVEPGEYRIAAAADLMEGQKQDSAAIARLAADGAELTLNSRESRTMDLRLVRRP